VIAIAECFKTEEFTSEAQRVLYNSLNSINSVPVQRIVIKSQELAVSEVVAIMAATSCLVVKLVSYITKSLQSYNTFEHYYRM